MPLRALAVRVRVLHVDENVLTDVASFQRLIGPRERPTMIAPSPTLNWA